MQKKKKVLQVIEKSIDREIYDFSVEYTQYAGHATELAADASKRGIDAVVAVGGDGTVNEVGRALVHSNTAMGVIPCGSGNGFARHLGIPLGAKQAIEFINKAVPTKIDYGKINNRPFFCACGVGFDAVVSEKFAKCGTRGLGTYIREGLKTWRIYHPETYQVTIDGVTQEHNAMFITVGNSNQWGNEAKITPLADCSDGILDITVVNNFKAIEIPWLAGMLMTGNAHKSPHVQTYRGKHITITRSNEGPAHADGDWFEVGKVLDIKVIPHALKVLVP